MGGIKVEAVLVPRLAQPLQLLDDVGQTFVVGKATVVDLRVRNVGILNPLHLVKCNWKPEQPLVDRPQHLKGMGRAGACSESFLSSSQREARRVFRASATTGGRVSGW
jgi:hypothetical protein